MLYELTEAQEATRRSIQALAQKVIAPRASEIDEKAEFLADVWEHLAEDGWLRIIFPKAYGGTGDPVLITCIVVEEIARVCASTSLMVACHSLGSTPMNIAANPEQKARYFPKLARGEQLVGFCLTEPEGGSDVASLRTRAVLEGDHYRLNGAKRFISNGGVAGVYTVFAKTDPSLGAKGLSAFIVEESSPGFRVGRLEHKLGIRGNPTAEIILKDCLVPKENLLGKEGDGFRIAMQTLDRSRITIGAQALGIAQGALDCLIGYTKEQMALPTPLVTLPAIRSRLAEMAIRVQAARLLVYKAAVLAEDGSKDAGMIASMAKCFASDVATWLTIEGVQLLGDPGYTKDYPLERMMRDAKITQIYEGTNEIQRLVIARQLLT